MTLLSVDAVTKEFGGLKALADVNFTVEKGEFVAIIGPNGAGKSTFLNVVTGLSAATRGRVVLNGKEITNAPTHQRIRAGLGRTFQHGRLFERLTVLENVMVGAAVRSSETEVAMRERAAAILSEMGLEEETHRQVSELSYGKRRMAELCRAIACSPQLLLLDEPAAGLNTGEVERLIERLRDVQRKYSTAIVLIEHNMGMVMRLAERIMVLNFGCNIAEGTPSQVQTDPAVLTAYLGEGYKDVVSH